MRGGRKVIRAADINKQKKKKLIFHIQNVFELLHFIFVTWWNVKYFNFNFLSFSASHTTEQIFKSLKLFLSFNYIWVERNKQEKLSHLFVFRADSLMQSALFAFL